MVSLASVKIVDFFRLIIMKTSCKGGERDRELEHAWGFDFDFNVSRRGAEQHDPYRKEYVPIIERIEINIEHLWNRGIDGS